jgi:hypothetical protein
MLPGPLSIDAQRDVSIVVRRSYPAELAKRPREAQIGEHAELSENLDVRTPGEGSRRSSESGLPAPTPFDYVARIRMPSLLGVAMKCGRIAYLPAFYRTDADSDYG